MVLINTKKICLVANTAWSMLNFRRGVIQSLISLGYDVVVLAPYDDAFEKLEKMGCTVVDLNMDARGINPIKDLFLIGRLYYIYKRLRPSLIVHYTIKPNIYGSLAAKAAGFPALAITTGLGYTFLNDNLVAKVARCLYKFAFKFPKEVWFLNDDDMQTFLARNLVSPQKAKLLHGEGVDTDYYAPKFEVIHDNKVRFLLIARMLWDKGVGEYVKAAEIVKKSHPDVVFQLLGACGVANPSVIEREQVAVWEEQGIVEYLGTTQDVRPYIAQSTCVVLPSYREGIPRTLLEAAAMAKPLIATDVPGCRDVVVDGETGFICDVKNPTSLANALIKFIKMDASERLEMGNVGRDFVESKFSENLVIQQYMETIKRLAN
jgi:glycosyltransferase involved in cell wall biosynthesis